MIAVYFASNITKESRELVLTIIDQANLLPSEKQEELFNIATQRKNMKGWLLNTPALFKLEFPKELNEFEEYIKINLPYYVDGKLSLALMKFDFSPEVLQIADQINRHFEKAKVDTGELSQLGLIFNKGLFLCLEPKDQGKFVKYFKAVDFSYHFDPVMNLKIKEYFYKLNTICKDQDSICESNNVKEQLQNAGLSNDLELSKKGLLKDKILIENNTNNTQNNNNTIDICEKIESIEENKNTEGLYLSECCIEYVKTWVRQMAEQISSLEITVIKKIEFDKNKFIQEQNKSIEICDTLPRLYKFLGLFQNRVAELFNVRIPKVSSVLNSQPTSFSDLQNACKEIQMDVVVELNSKHNFLFSAPLQNKKLGFFDKFFGGSNKKNKDHNVTTGHDIKNSKIVPPLKREDLNKQSQQSNSIFPNISNKFKLFESEPVQSNVNLINNNVIDNNLSSKFNFQEDLTNENNNNNIFDEFDFTEDTNNENNNVNEEDNSNKKEDKNPTDSPKLN